MIQSLYSTFSLQSPRLILRDLVESDLEIMHRLRSDSNVIRMFENLRSDSNEDSWQWLMATIMYNQARPRKLYNLAIICKDSEEIIGWIRFGRPDDHALGDYDFGYALLPSAWDQGYATEALTTIIDYCFENLGARQIFGESRADNRGALRVMEKAGLKQTHSTYEADISGEWIEMVRYTIQQSTWRAQRHL